MIGKEQTKIESNKNGKTTTSDGQPTTSKPQTSNDYIGDQAQGVITTGIQRLDEKLSRDRASLLMIFGIFASLVTFLLIEIQILKNICDFWRLLGFSLFILGSLLSFIFILQYIAKSWIENDKSIKLADFLKNFKKPLEAIKINFSILLALLIIVFLFYFGYKSMKNAHSEFLCKENEILEKIQKENNQKTETLNDRVNQFDVKLREFNNKLESFENRK